MSDTPSIRRLRQEVREFVAEEIAAGTFEPRCDAWLSGHNPGFSRKVAGKGWIGMTWPKRFGGQDLSYLERYAVLEEFLSAGAPVAAHWIADRQAGPLLISFGSEEQRQRYLPAVARGERFFCIGMSEPDSGSDLASIKTRAERVDGGWRVRGSKVWISHAHRSHYMVTLVRTSLVERGSHEGLSQLIIDLQIDGVQVRPIALLSGDRHFNEVTLEDAFVPSEMLIGKEGNGWEQVTSELAYERSGPERFLSTFPLFDQLVREIGVEPDTRQSHAIGELTGRLWSLRSLSVAVAARLQAGQQLGSEAAMVKDLGTRFERDVIDTARLLVPPESGSERFRRLYAEAVVGAPGFTLRGGSSEILRGIVARSLHRVGPAGPALGIDAEVHKLLVETADAVFRREGVDRWIEVERAGLDDIGETGLTEAAIAVRVSAYHGTEIQFAERVLLPDPSDVQRGALMRSVQMCGCMARVRDLAVTYAAQRHQFGQPLNRFQAIQHQLAELVAEAAAADAIVAATLVDPSRERIAAAKVVTGRAAGRVAAIAHQVHGALGLTQEHPLHRFTSRLSRWRDEFGTEAEWAIDLGRTVARHDLWEATTQ